MGFRGAATFVASFVLTGLLLAGRAPAQSEAARPIVIDATAETVAPGPANYTYVAAEAKSPDGHVLGLNAQYLTLDGKPWLPVMGEMHYSRVPEAEWEEDILKMKSAGVQIVAAYIIWIHHEEVEGEWDWQGQKDLRRFVQLCQKHGLYVVPRIGPWSHAEVRNGGFPDWLLQKTTQQRNNDPAYLKYVDAYYRQIGDQLKGLMWSQGGPVIAVQLENEYSRRGPLGGEQHILRLKEMAREAGMRVPFYTETGWDRAAIPKGAVLTVGGGYPDAPWDASIQALPPNGVYAFHFDRRATTDMGAQGPVGGAPAQPMAGWTGYARDTPYLTAEMGGGMQITYHRRPVVSADDIVAMVPVALGGGVNLYGSYMFQGGENPDGKLTTLQESLATHAPNDLPVKSYDFEAFLGEFGDERPSLLKEKSWNYFMNDFGPELAPMQPRQPDAMPSGPGDFSVSRVSARTAGTSGFLFVNNHVRGSALPARIGFQVEVKLPGGKSVLLPERPTTVAADNYFVWPFGMDLGGVTLRYATAQPLARLGTDAAPVMAFFAQPGIAPEFVVEDAPGLKVDRTAGVERREGAIWVHGLTPGPDERVRFALPDGRSVTVLVLRQEDADHGWKIATKSVTEMLVTPDQAFVDGDVATLEDLGAKTFQARLVGTDGMRLVASETTEKLTRSGVEVRAIAGGDTPAAVPIVATETKQPGQVAPLPVGFKPADRPRVVAGMPTEADWSRAGIWSLTLPKTPAPVGERRFLSITYAGDVMRLSESSKAGGKLLADNFADGRPWLVGLERFQPELAKGPLELSIYPLRRDAPVFFEPSLQPKIDGAQIDRLESVKLVTQYSLKLKMEAAQR